MIFTRERNRIYWLIIIIIVFLFFMDFYIKNIYALSENRRVYHMPDEISILFIESVDGFDRRETEIYGNILYVYTNHDKKIILVRGIETERKKIEKYFILRAPSTYQLIFSIDSTCCGNDYVWIIKAKSEIEK